MVTNCSFYRIVQMSRTFLKNIKLGFISCALNFMNIELYYLGFWVMGRSGSVDMEQIHTHRLQTKNSY